MATTTLPQTTTAYRRVRYALMLLLIVFDIAAINLGFLLSYQVHLDELRLLFRPPSQQQIIWALVVLNTVFSVTFWTSGLYQFRRGTSRIDEAYVVFRAVSIATVVVIAFNTLFPVMNVTTRTLVIGWLLSIALVVIERTVYRSFVRLLRRRGHDTRRVLIVGGGEIGQLVYRQFNKAPELGYRVVGFLSDQYITGHEVAASTYVLGNRSRLPQVVETCQIDEVVIALSGASYNEILSLLNLIEDEHVAIKIYPDAFQLITNHNVSVGELSGLPLVTLRAVPLDQRLNRVIKRAMDIAVAAVALICLSPLLLLVALLVWLDSPGPVFFVQERVGRDGRPFNMIKFRSMRIDAEQHGTWTRPNDDRRTRLGSFIRRFSIDELPQFINVLLGDMSVVGPRPEQPRYVEQFSQHIPRYMQRHREKAGITGWAQVNGLRGDTSIEERTRYDLYYVENWSPLFDLKIILHTAYNTLRGEDNAY